MSIFESGVRDDRRTVGARLNAGLADVAATRPLDRIGRAPVFKPVERRRSGLATTFLAGCRLLSPVLLLVATAAAALIYGDAPAGWLGNLDVGGKPFPVGLLALPLTFFVVQLTNRRYGASYAVAQLFIATAAIVAGFLYAGDTLAQLRGENLPEPRLILAFGIALFAAQLVAIFVFDRLRGPFWWQAPLFASLFGGIVLGCLAYPIAYSGSDQAWSQPMMAFVGIAMIESILLIGPYWALRAIIAPLPGFGGY